MNGNPHNRASRPCLGSDEVRSSEPEFLAVGRVLRPHALRGELKVEIHTDYPERFVPGKQLYLGEEHAPHVIEGVRFHQGDKPWLSSWRC